MSATTVAKQPGRSWKDSALAIVKRQETGLLGVIIVLGLLVSLANENFLTRDNLYNVLQTVVVIGIIAIGQTFILIGKEIDLSVGSVLALSAVSAGAAFGSGVNPWLAMLIGIGVGALSGLAVGTVVVLGRVSSFIVTLGMLSIARGLTQLLTGGLPQAMPRELSFIGQGRIFGGIPVSVVIFLVLVILGQLLLTRTVFGLRVTAVGDNDTAARTGGIPVGRTRILSFMLIGTLAGVAGIVFATQVGVAEAQAGMGYELDVIAAAVIGGASLSGGRGSIIGAFLGACLLGVLRNAFILLALSPFLQQLSIGLVIVLAALFDQWRQGNLRHLHPKALTRRFAGRKA
ncbi:ABC transporter permease [Polymorphospora rubra]|uniref:Sugar ABC transporter permease n=1 Tax=Polymorphospora rubra TaxID=338584 RepID=A0A810MT24_9ACTN|nr:ABC transporter permease [Polymorphospora rubra]BCJ63650.1 sugar ABC transporter permease [Polymorphospora rubra]